MKFRNLLTATMLTAVCAAALSSLTGCKKLALQKDYSRVMDTVDAHVNMSAWDYLKKRALGTVSSDQIWKTFYDAILYSEIDTLEYTKPNRTYIFLNTEAITRTNNNLADVGIYAAIQVNGKNGTKLTDYPKAFLKNYLSYLIIDGVYNHYTLPPANPLEVKTLAPAGSFSSLPAGLTYNSSYPFYPNNDSKMKLKVLNSSPSNTSDYPIVINESRNVRTSSILATNGTIHAVDRFVTTVNP
ncbi:hypothetical protein [Sediminibacterium soli]|uniref:hypothetical protein n=1 Tax=Sediminibacterium soli TaxID=2698829 RepID=UPI00137A99E1|nr:hypothetical protein [Sediminibacterium soli]NCI47410.1 hypothetical protein [Sediminibacterium soli]